MCALGLVGSYSSCTDYLDKEPDSTISGDVAFTNFINFQGFVEEIYNCIPDKEKNYWCTNFNWGDDELLNTGLGDTHFTAHADVGDYRFWYNDPQNFLHSNSLNPASWDTNVGAPRFDHSIEHGWYCIRKANMGLENLDKMVSASDEEKDVIKGQLLFFRAWWHQQQMEFFGGLPYVDRTLSADEVLQLPRLSFQECAKRCAEDYSEAAKLLPGNWDEAAVGIKTSGKNDLRITRACALGYLGKVLLWAASPLNNEKETGGAQRGASKNGNTYKYDKELAKQAADALAEAIQDIDDGKTPYALAGYDYSNIYDHVAGSKPNFSEIFYTSGQNFKMPGTCEAIMRGPSRDGNSSNWNFAKTWGPKVNGLVPHDAFIHMPTANYVNYYGMANGLPLDDPESGFDPTHPFKDRDPRFYHDIMFDGFKFVSESSVADEDKDFVRMQLFTGGNLRQSSNPVLSSTGSRTGYFCQKLVPHQMNKYDKWYEWGTGFHSYLPYMRVADIYLMYAEACAAVGGASYKSAKCKYSAVAAINVIRKRCGAGEVAEKYLADNNKFMDEVRRERAVELAFEGFRWNDLQRWLLLTEYPYNIKTSQEFYRVGEMTADPRDAEVTGWREEVVVRREYAIKHYLFPLRQNEVYLYSEYPQNPGW